MLTASALEVQRMRLGVALAFTTSRVMFRQASFSLTLAVAAFFL